MAKLFFAALLAVSCSALVFANEDTVANDLATITRNAIFQARLAKVAIENQIFGTYTYEMKSAKTEEEQLCMGDCKHDAVNESADIVAGTVGEILSGLSKAGTDMKDGKVDDVKKFLDNTDYPKYKKEAMDKFKNKMKDFIVATQQKMEKCVKH